MVEVEERDESLPLRANDVQTTTLLLPSVFHWKIHVIHIPTETSWTNLPIYPQQGVVQLFSVNRVSVT